MARPPRTYEGRTRTGKPIFSAISSASSTLRAMQTLYDAGSLELYMKQAVEASPEHPVLIDRFLKDATEVDLDLVADRTGRVLVGGVMEHIQEAGVHSGDAAATLPPHSLTPDLIERMKDQAAELARELGVVGLMNVQFAIQGKTIYILEVNPRASRTVPFVSKATGRPLAKIAAKVMVGRTLDELGIQEGPLPTHVSVKESVFPFNKFPGVDTILGPEMKSTGEVMGIATDMAVAFGKSQLATGFKIPRGGSAFVSVNDDDKIAACHVARRLRNLGFRIVATRGTAKVFERARIPVETINKVLEGPPHIGDAIREGRIHLVVNTTQGTKAIRDSYAIRRGALLANVPYFTTLSAALAAVSALEAWSVSGSAPPQVRSVQEWHTRSR